MGRSDRSVVRCLALGGWFDSNPLFYRISLSLSLSLSLSPRGTLFLLSFAFCAFCFLHLSLLLSILDAFLPPSSSSLEQEMAVELMMGFTGDAFPTKTEENAVEEAASAGIQSMERLLRLLSQSQQQQQQIHAASDASRAAAASQQTEMDYTAAADAAVTKFRKVISLLGRTRTGHARFRRAPVPSLPQMDNTQERFQGEKGGEMEGQEFPKVYCPTPIQRLPPPPPPLPFSHHHHNHHLHHQQHSSYSLLSIPKAGGGIDAAKAFTSPPPSTANSFASSLTGDAETKNLGSGSTASAFQIVNLSQVSSSSGRPPLSSSS